MKIDQGHGTFALNIYDYFEIQHIAIINSQTLQGPLKDFANKSMEKEKLLAFGYIRENCKVMNIDLIAEDIIILLAIWVTICDSFDVYFSDPKIEIGEIEMEDGKMVVSTMSRIPRMVGEYDVSQTAFGKDIVKKGDVKTWKFQLLFKEENAKPEFLIGIIDDKILKRFKQTRFRDRVGDFTSSTTQGYGLWKGTTGAIRFYHKETGAKPYPYGQLFNYKLSELK